MQFNLITLNTLVFRNLGQQRVTGKTAEELKLLVSGRKRRSAGASVTEVSYSKCIIIFIIYIACNV